MAARRSCRCSRSTACPARRVTALHRNRRSGTRRSARSGQRRDARESGGPAARPSTSRCAPSFDAVVPRDLRPRRHRSQCAEREARRELAPDRRPAGASRRSPLAQGIVRRHPCAAATCRCCESGAWMSAAVELLRERPPTDHQPLHGLRQCFSAAQHRTEPRRCIQTIAARDETGGHPGNRRAKETPTRGARVIHAAPPQRVSPAVSRASRAVARRAAPHSTVAAEYGNGRRSSIACCSTTRW